MTLTVERPAPFVELVAMFAATGTGKLSPALAARRQGLMARSWGYRAPDGMLVACAGLYPLPPSETGTPRLEAWFQSRLESAAHMLAFVRLAQLTLAAVADDASIEVVARVAHGHAPGARLARAIGFRPGPDEAGAQTWVWTSWRTS